MPEKPFKQSQWDRREDGSLKGYGFLGNLARPEGVSSEISMGFGIDGQEVEIPLLVPTLTADEVKYLLSVPPDSLRKNWQHPTVKAIADKAITFARQRMAQGLPVFARPGEQLDTQYPNVPRVAVQNLNGDISLPNQSGQRDPRLGSLGYLTGLK